MKGTDMGASINVFCTDKLFPKMQEMRQRNVFTMKGGHPWKIANFNLDSVYQENGWLPLWAFDYQTVISKNKMTLTDLKMLFG